MLVMYVVVLPLISVLLIWYIITYCLDWFSLKSSCGATGSGRCHEWETVSKSRKAWSCSQCEKLFQSGFLCPDCGAFSCRFCLKKINLRVKCKVMLCNGNSINHQWIKGNVSDTSNCIRCKKKCGQAFESDFSCCWCQNVAHAKCLPLADEVCDLGKYRCCIIPPWCIDPKSKKRSSEAILNIKDPGWAEWNPLFVLANTKSGSREGAKVISAFRVFLNPIQVVDLSSFRPESVIRLCSMIAPRSCNILVAGGDGTAGWVLSSIHKAQLKPHPAVALMPLGTGNDLARVLEWDEVDVDELNVREIINAVLKQRQMLLDRWRLQIVHFKHMGLQIPTSLSYMYNYLSVGVDAQVAYSFHTTRQSAFYVWGSRLFNKMLYLFFGTQQIMLGDCKDLQKRLEVKLDGVEIELPYLESVVLLNIPSWGAGIDTIGLLPKRNRPEQRVDDGFLEVIGVSSSFHIAQMTVGLSSPIFLGQAKQVEITLKASTPMQVDGEPWMQHPAKIKVTNCLDQAVLLRGKKSAKGGRKLTLD